MAETYSVKIPVFEGPLDLLLHLLKKNEIDIYDIPISLITRQYLEYLALLKELNLEIAGDFLVMAATLIQIKSRMLLPVDEQPPGEEFEDPRLELVHRLLEYQSLKEASLALREIGERWSDVVYRAPLDDDGSTGEAETLSLFDLSFFDLVTAFKKILDTAPPETISITKETLTIKDRISRILETLEGNETVRFEELFEAGAARAVVMVTFLALLEVLRLGLARVYQEQEFGPIWVVTANPSPEPSPEGDAQEIPATTEENL